MYGSFRILELNFPDFTAFCISTRSEVYDEASAVIKNFPWFFCQDSKSTQCILCHAIRIFCKCPRYMTVEVNNISMEFLFLFFHGIYLFKITMKFFKLSRVFYAALIDSLAHQGHTSMFLSLCKCFRFYLH